VYKQYRNLEPVQWLGPEAAWIKYGNPLKQPWRIARQAPGSDWDNPVPENIAISGDLIAYYDSPGPNLNPTIPNIKRRPSLIKTLQNFTGWVVGKPISRGASQRLCELAAWFSVVTLADFNWAEPSSVPKWQRIGLNRSGTGWIDVNETPTELKWKTDQISTGTTRVLTD